MATKNPFGQLRVARDEDEEVPQKTSSKAAAATPLFQKTEPLEQKKKKKVRPEEKKRSTDEPKTQEANEGFEVVGKLKPQKHQRRNNATEEEEDEAGKFKENLHANKLGIGHHSHTVRPVRAGKRQFERHSGTGRGREIAKNGAGAKTVWGDNPEFIAKQSMREDVTNDKFFDFALNPRPRKIKEEISESPGAEETPKAQETAPTAETQAEGQTQPEQQQQQETEKQRKKKTFEEKPINPEDLLEIPENALSLAEYREQLKEKNRKIQGSAGNAQLNVQLPSDLKKLEKETFGVKAAEKKPEAKPAKKENALQEITVNFKTEGSGFQSRGDRADYNYENKKKAKVAPKIRFEDLPSL